MATIPSPNVALYGNMFVVGPSGPTGPTGQFEAVHNSGFSTIVLFTLFVHPHGDIVYAAVPPPIVAGGAFAHDRYGSLNDTISALKTGGSVKLVLFSIGAGSAGAFPNMQKLLQTEEGTLTLQENFAALMEALPAIDGFVFDDEVLYDVNTNVRLIRMLTADGTNGKIIAFCPYTQQSTWTQTMQVVHSEFSSMTGPTGPATLQPVAWWNVQCYPPGGAFNGSILPAWVAACSTTGTGITAGAAPAFIVPGLGAPATPPSPTGPAGVQDQFATWSRDVPGLDGGFIYSCDGMSPWATRPPFSGYTPQEYANAIINGLKGIRA